MRQLAVIPPMLFDADRQVMNMWSEQEKETFREK